MNADSDGTQSLKGWMASMTYEELKLALAEHGITPESYAVLTNEKIEIATADLGGPEEWLPTRYSSVEELLGYDSRATDDEIRQVEEALGITLPNDYVLFLKEYGGPDPLEQQREAGWGGLFSARWIEGYCQLVEQQQSWGWEGQFVKIGEFYTYEEAFDMDSGHIGFLVKDGACIPKVVWLDPEYADYDNIAECSRELGDVPDFLLDLFKSDPANGQEAWGEDEDD